MPHRIRKNDSGASEEIVRTFEEYISSKNGSNQWARYHSIRTKLIKLVEDKAKEMMDGAKKSGGKGVDGGELKQLINCFKDIQTTDPMYQYVIGAGKVQGRNVGKRVEFLDGDGKKHSIHGEVSAQEMAGMKDGGARDVKIMDAEVVDLGELVKEVKDSASRKDDDSTFHDRTDEILEGLGDGDA